MEKVLQILVVLALLILAINYYIKAEKTRFRLYHAAGRVQAPADLLWNLRGMDPDNQLLFMAANEGVLQVLDSNTGELLTHIQVGADPGTQVFDPETEGSWLRTDASLPSTAVAGVECWVFSNL